MKKKKILLKYLRSSEELAREKLLEIQIQKKQLS